MWEAFVAKHPKYANRELPISYYFCDNQYDADDCANLVLSGDKCATAPSLWWFENEKEPLPQIGDLEIVTNWDGRAMAIIQITDLIYRPYKKIDADFAFAEGEGDKSLAYWKKVHQAFYTREMESHGAQFSEDMTIVCIYFELVYAKEEM
ncbi:MAG: ASCH domain-containing protein [Flavobacteriaceae bacterium]|nr:ASCH domain-containing protein [Flavobacteriaceae bacterium]